VDIVSEATERGSNDEETISPYAPTPYVQTTWLVLNEEKLGSSGFAPLQAETLSTMQRLRDPMFEDYSGIMPANNGPEWGGVDAFQCQQQDGDAAARELELRVREEQLEEQLEEQRKQRELAEQAALIQDSYTRGLEEGRNSARTEAEENLKALEARLSNTLDDMRVQISESLTTTEQKAAELALLIARKLIGSVAESSSDYILPIVKEAIALSGSAQIKHIRVGTRDYEFLQNIKPAALGAESDAAWSFEADDSIHIGCVVVTTGGEVDLNLEQAWERIRAQILVTRGEG
jgi:flagellar assembly protein FliH